MSGYVYIKSEKAGSWTDGLGRRESWGDLWTVGFYDPKGEWHSESDHNTSEAAADRVSYLNGAAFHESKGTRP